MLLCREPRSSRRTGNLNVALALSLQQVVGGEFSLPALQCLGLVASQTPLVIGIPDPHSSKDKDSQKLPGGTAGTAHLAGVQACGRGAPEEPQRHHILEEQGWQFLSVRPKRKNPLWMTPYSSFVFPTPAPFFSSALPTLQEDALGVGFVWLPVLCGDVLIMTGSF